jgi:hypothetical protein
MEHFHRMLKAAIMCYKDQHWTGALLLVLLSIRTAFRKKMLQLLVHGRPITVSTDRIKPAYMLNGSNCGATTSNPTVDKPWP